MDITRPIFIVSSGRSGTATLAKLFRRDSRIESHHEYLCTHIQKIACLRTMGYLSDEDCALSINEIYSAALTYSKKPIFLDSSNKLSWIIDILYKLFPNAKFIHIVRDGRKVASSYFYKLHDECYDDESVKILLNSVLKDKILPPPEKKYYWPVPIQDKIELESFLQLDQFGRICWHWGYVNKKIEYLLKVVPAKQKFFVKLEDLVLNKEILRELFNFVGATYEDEIHTLIQTPYNVNKPVDTLLDDSKKNILNQVAGDMLEKYGYKNSNEYKMSYLNNVINEPLNEQ